MKFKVTQKEFIAAFDGKKLSEFPSEIILEGEPVEEEPYLGKLHQYTKNHELWKNQEDRFEKPQPTKIDPEVQAAKWWEEASVWKPINKRNIEKLPVAPVTIEQKLDELIDAINYLCEWQNRHEQEENNERA
jgi:hypothetical protein